MLKEDLNWKLLLDPELEFPEAHMRNEIEIENASMKDFLMELIKNLVVMKFQQQVLLLKHTKLGEQ